MGPSLPVFCACPATRLGLRGDTRQAGLLPPRWGPQASLPPCFVLVRAGGGLLLLSPAWSGPRLLVAQGGWGGGGRRAPSCGPVSLRCPCCPGGAPWAGRLGSRCPGGRLVRRRGRGQGESLASLCGCNKKTSLRSAPACVLSVSVPSGLATHPSPLPSPAPLRPWGSALPCSPGGGALSLTKAVLARGRCHPSCRGRPQAPLLNVSAGDGGRALCLESPGALDHSLPVLCPLHAGGRDPRGWAGVGRGCFPASPPVPGALLQGPPLDRAALPEGWA